MIKILLIASLIGFNTSVSHAGTYKLRTQSELEQFVKENNNLSDVPSRLEVKVEDISLGEMNTLWLQKIEELTLYMIEQQKVNALQQKEIDQLKTKINSNPKNN